MKHRTAEEIASTERGPRPVPPVLPDPPASVLPTVDIRLPSGLRVIAVGKPGVPMAEVRLRIPFTPATTRSRAAAEVMAGTMFTDDAGLAHIGGNVDFVVKPDRLAMDLSTLSSGLTTLLRLMAVALTGVGYPEDRVARARDRAAHEAAMTGADPSALAWAALRHRQFGDHPAAIEIADPDEIATITAAEVRALHTAAVVPRGAVLVVVSDLDPDRVVADVAHALGSWAGDHPAGAGTPLSEPAGGEVHWLARPGTEQAQIRLYAPAPHRADPGFVTVELANLVFGGYFSSRLVENLRERRGFAYLVDAQPEFYGPTASLVIRADTGAEVGGAAVAEIQRELARLATEPPTDAEIDAARRYASGTLLAIVSSKLGLATQLAHLTWSGLGIDWLTTHPVRLAEVSADDVRAAARHHLADAQFAGVVISDR